MSAGSLPSSVATTLRDSMRRIVLCSVIDAFTPSGTGLKSGFAAAAFSWSKSWPAILNSFTAVSRVIQPSMADRCMFSSGDSRLNSSPAALCRIAHG